MGVVVKACLLLVRLTVLNPLFVIAIGSIALLRLYLRWTWRSQKAPGYVTGQTAIVTGANTGIGFEVAKTLADRGARVILACRNMGSAHQAKAAIVKATGNNNIELRQLDLGSLWSVRQFAKEMVESDEEVNLLVHCAGVAGVRNSRSRDDLQITWQVNFLAPFLLTNLLLEKLKSSAPSRIVYLSSVLHHFHQLDPNSVDLINDEKSYSNFRSYCGTQMATILYMKHLALQLNNTGVTVNIANPGLVNVPLLKRIQNELFQSLRQSFLDTFAKTIEQGAVTVVKLCVDSQLQNTSGKYFSNCKESGCLSASAKNMELARRLWEKSRQLVDFKESDLHS